MRVISVESLNLSERRGNYSATSNNMKLIHWPLMGWLLHLVQRGGDWARRSPPSPLLAVPNVTAHPSTDSVPITVLLRGFNVPTDGLIHCRNSNTRHYRLYHYIRQNVTLCRFPLRCAGCTRFVQLLVKFSHSRLSDTFCQFLPRFQRAVDVFDVVVTFDKRWQYSDNVGNGARELYNLRHRLSAIIFICLHCIVPWTFGT